MYNKFIKFKAGLVELADTLGLDPSGEIRGSSSLSTSIGIIPVETKMVDVHDCESWLVSSNLTNRIFSKKDLTSFRNDDIILLSSDGGTADTQVLSTCVL